MGQLISHCGGRVYDWYEKASGSSWNEAANASANDPCAAALPPGSGARSIRDGDRTDEEAGPEFAGRTMQTWAARNCLELRFIRPGLLQCVQPTRSID
jgi:hypothetical protein